MSESVRGSQVSACGVLRGEPYYTHLPSGTPALSYWLSCQNPSGKGVQLRVVSYGEAAKGESRVLQAGSQVFLTGTLQSRLHGDLRLTEVVSQQVMTWQGECPPLQQHGAQAVLVGEITERPAFTLLGEARTPFVKFALRCANPKGQDAYVAVVHFGYLAATYAATLASGMKALISAEARSHYYYPKGYKGVYVLQFVTENVQVLGSYSSPVRAEAALPVEIGAVP